MKLSKASTTIDDWIVERELGSDQNGIFYQCRHHELPYLHATVQVLDWFDDSDTAVRQEGLARCSFLASKQQGLAHPGLVRVQAAGRSSDRLYVVMDGVEGSLLATNVSQVANDPLAVLEIGYQIADALAYAHAKGVWHGGLGLGNIIRDAQEQVRILAPGVALSVRRAPSHFTPVRADVMALGVVLYELLIGRAATERFQTLDPGPEQPVEVRTLIQELTRPDAPLCMAEVKQWLQIWSRSASGTDAARAASPDQHGARNHGSGCAAGDSTFAVTREQSEPLLHTCISTADGDSDIFDSDGGDGAPATATAPDQGTQQSIGRYSVLDTIGRGGMGEVLLAYDPQLDRQVAIKRIRADTGLSHSQHASIRREARLAARLNHSSIVQIFDLLTEDGVDHIVMEYVPGQSLRRLLDRGTLTLDRILLIAVSIAEGLAFAHRRGVVHRDLKTENVLISYEGKAKITDFGIARRLLANPQHEAPLRGNAVVGTYRVMSPEQTRGAVVDARSDLFSLGVLLYEILTRTSPFLGETKAATIARILKHNPAPIHQQVADIPRPLSDLVEHLLAKNPESRPRNAEEVTESLRSMAQQMTAPEHNRNAVGNLGTGEGTDTQGDNSNIFANSARTRPKSAERRQVTVLSCTLVNESDDANPLDPETLYEILPGFQNLTRVALERFGGHLGSTLGHRLLAYFGYPRAHEDDAQRAVLAALAIVNGLGQFNADSSIRLAVRMGIHTGPAIITGRFTQQEPLALGRTLDQTSELRDSAQPNHIVVSATTYQLIAGFFDTEPLEPLSSPGEEAPLARYRVSAARDVRNRVEIQGALAPLVARKRELALLLDRWQGVKTGAGHVVLLSGEAGIGKSRLVHTFQDQLRGDVPIWLMCHGSPYAQNEPLYPVVELLRRLLGLDEHASKATQVDRLEQTLAEYGPSEAEALPLLAALLSLSAQETDQLASLRPETRRKKTLDALVALLVGVAQRRPTVLVVEDAHWLDPSTCEFLDMLVGEAAAISLLALLTYRVNFAPPWAHQAYVTQLSLPPLTEHEVSALIDHVTGGRALPDSVRTQLIARTDGVPLFVEEVTKSVIESDLLTEHIGRFEVADPLRPLNVPVTLRESLAARLDRLDTAKEVAQLGAVLGREFPFALLSAVSPLDESDLLRALDKLVQAQLLYRRGFLARNSVYTFKHALIHDAAYNSLLERHRRQIHEQAARMLEERFPAVVEAQPEMLGHHCEQAGLIAEAVHYHQRAGERATEQSAFIEATRYFSKAIESLRKSPESPERHRHEIELLSALGANLLATKGYAADEVKHTFERAYMLCEEIHDTPLRIRYGIWSVRFMRGDRREVDETVAWFQQFAQSSQDPVSLLMAHYILGIRALVGADYARAREHMEQNIARFDPEQHIEVARTYGGCGGFYGHLMMSVLLWMTGYPDQARKHQTKVLAMVEDLRDPYTRAMALVHQMHLAYFFRTPDEAHAAAEGLVALASELAFPWLLAMGTCGMGWAVTQNGDPDRGIAQIEAGLSDYRMTGIQAYYPSFLAYLAESLLVAGRVDEGLAVVDNGIARCQKYVDCYYEPELQRLRGEMLYRQQGDAAPQAEQVFRNAVRLASQQGAKSLELRAAISLSRLLDQEGQRAEALTALRTVYEWFTEGHDTQDLGTAKALLAKMTA